MSADGRGGFGGEGNQAWRDAGGLEQRLENLVLWGKVEQRNEQALKVRVRFGDASFPAQSILSPWLLCGERSWFNTRESNGLPDVGQWVLVLNSSGIIENGVIIASLPYRDGDKGFVHPTKSGDDERKFYGPVKVVADIIKNSLRTFNRVSAIFWHYVKDNGKMRFEVGKNNNTNAYFQVQEDKIEMRVGTTKLVISADGIQGFHSGTAASFALDKEGFTVALRQDSKFANVPADNYGGAEGSPAGDGVETVGDIKETTFRIRNGRIEQVMDDVIQTVMTQDAVVTTIKDGAQHIVSKSSIEATVTGQDGSASTILTANSAEMEVRGGVPLKLKLSGGEANLSVALSHILLTEIIGDIRIPGAAVTLDPTEITLMASNVSVDQSPAPPALPVAPTPPTAQATALEHKDVKVPDDLGRPVVELGVNPFTPSY